MGFDVFYLPCRFGTEPVETANPFTGEVRAVLPNIPLSSQDLGAVQDVLERAGAIVPEGGDDYLVKFGDGGVVNVFSREDLESDCVPRQGRFRPCFEENPGVSHSPSWSFGHTRGCMAAIRRGLTPELLRFLFDLLRAADWIMLPAMEGNPAITALPGRAAGFESFPEVVCHSAEELGDVLAGGYESWRVYRDRVMAQQNQM